jgi:drug/metabolite transporter (DMT)-like permease
MLSTRPRGIGYALAGSLMFGLGAVLAQIVGREIEVTLIAVTALSLGGLLLTLVLSLTGTSLFRLPTLTRSAWAQLLLLAGPGTTLPLLLIVSGLSHTSALEGGFIIQLNGVAALVFAFILLGERVRTRQGIGIILLLVGSALVVWSGAAGGGGAGANSLIGDGLILAGALGIGFGYIPAKQLSSRFDSLPLTALRLLIGAVMVLPVLGLEVLLGSPHTLLWRPSLATLWVALPIYILTNFCLAYFMQQEGLRLLMAWEVAAIMQTTPLFSAVLAVLLLQNTMTPEQVLGGLLAFAGGLIVSLPEKGTNRLEREKEVGPHAASPPKLEDHPG